MSFREIKICRLCGSNKLLEITNFGTSPVGNNLQESLQNSKAVDVYPLALQCCEECNHYQLTVSISPDILYATNYTYLSRTGRAFVKHMDDLIDDIIQKYPDIRESSVFEVGSNDGTLLKKFYQRGFTVCGIDPASIAAGIANQEGIKTYNTFFSKDFAYDLAYKNHKFDLVVSQNVLAHIENLRDVFEGIYLILKHGGKFIFEVGYFLSVVENNLIDTIYHEHLDYHHANPLVRFLNKVGFSVEDIDINSIQGGSLRIYASKDNTIENSSNVKAFLANELKTILFNKKDMLLWRASVDYRFKVLKDKISKRLSDNCRLYAYGCPTKAVLLLNLLGLNQTHIKAIIEDNIYKVGKFLPYSGIKILSKESVELNESDMLIILAWNFYEDIKNNNIASGFFPPGLTLIKPLPETEFINV